MDFLTRAEKTRRMPMLGDWVRLDPKLGNLKPISVWKGSIYLSLSLLMYGISYARFHPSDKVPHT